MKNKKLNKFQQGFTLIELLVVMAILGMLAALVLPQLMGQVDGSRVNATQTQLKAFETALETHRLDTGKYPKSLKGLAENTTGKSRWRGPYLKSIPLDPWDNAYQYRVKGSSYELSSFGADGSQGGTEDNADIKL